MAQPMRRLRLFLDTGVIISGCQDSMGAARGVLILAAQTPNFTVVLSEAVDQEVRRIINRKVGSLDRQVAQDIIRILNDWRHQTETEWYATPTQDELIAHQATILPVLRHPNDMAIIVSAIQAQPDWLISSNVEHFTPDLARRAGLRIITPWDFIRQFYPS